MLRFYQVLLCLLSAVCTRMISEGQGHRGFQYSQFSGPVSGIIQEVDVPYLTYTHDKPHYVHSGTTKDYVAKPDYSFAYGVEDPETGNAQNHKEVRDGDTVRGEYNVVEPDGTLRTVRYTADAKNGFQATVHYSAGAAPPVPQLSKPAPPQRGNYDYDHGHGHDHDDDHDHDHDHDRY